MNQITPLQWWGATRMDVRLCYINDNSDLATKVNSVCKCSHPHWESIFIDNILNRIIRLFVWHWDEMTYRALPPMLACATCAACAGSRSIPYLNILWHAACIHKGAQCCPKACWWTFDTRAKTSDIYHPYHTTVGGSKSHPLSMSWMEITYGDLVFFFS